MQSFRTIFAVGMVTLLAMVTMVHSLPLDSPLPRPLDGTTVMTDKEMEDLFGVGGLEAWMASFNNTNSGNGSLSVLTSRGENMELGKKYPCEHTMAELFAGQIRKPGDSSPVCRTTSKSPKTEDVDWAINDFILHHGKTCGGHHKLKKCNEQPVNIKWRDHGCAVIGAQVRNGARYGCDDIPLYYHGIKEQCQKEYSFKEEFDVGNGDIDYNSGWESRVEGWQLINGVGDWGIVWIKNLCDYKEEFYTLKTPPPTEN
jgi:hypothetical protein